MQKGLSWLTMNDRVLWLIILVLATYTIIISFVSPMIHKKRMKEQEKARDIYLSKLKPGDKVIIISGIYGVIKGINNNIVKLEISKGVIIEIDKESIMGVLN
ncbi:preprotein translocase subunit YajC [Clostridium perfringens]|nr:preprotein translocase subunit YajC [Clostridium perfringens]MDM1006691.1 preprotein translocase subunit YajC [Clostridium perfringens]MDU3846169.1 preprotein translocase subunit YajC [Clostridium perfringens]MDU7726477.1 preprotein translocase subunit YajC [Clostridium perfringens]